MKRLLLILWGFLLLLSCSNGPLEKDVNLLSNTKPLMSMKTNDQSSDFVLVKKEKVVEEDLKTISNQLSIAYESSIPIYRYVYYSSVVTDHLYTVENSSYLNHDKTEYILEKQEFNLMPNSWGGTANVLYRHYSPVSKIHKLSFNSSESGFTNEGLLGYIFEKQEVGTVPLKEYYSSKRNSYLYVSRRVESEGWLPFHDTDFVYNKTVGYVYPGSAVDDLKEATRFIIKNTDCTIFPIELYLDVYVREKNSYWKLTYSVIMTMPNESVYLPINNTYIVISAGLNIKNKEGINIFTDITNPRFYSDQQGVKGSKVIILYKNISGYDVTYDFCYTFPVGCEKFL